MTAHQITVNVFDYLTDADMRQIMIDEFRVVAAQKAREDFQRILDNAAYELVRKEVDAVFDGGMAEAVKTRAIAVIDKLSDFTVFRKPDAWDREASKGWVHLQAAMDEAKPLISARVQQIVAGLGEENLRYLVEEQIGPAIIAKLTGAQP